MAERFEQVRGQDGELADWWVETLRAGQVAGGDSRGRQSSGVLVVRENGGYGGNNDRYLDLLVDDNPKPIKRFQKLLEMHHLYFGVVDPNNLIPLSEVATKLQEILCAAGYTHDIMTGVFDEPTRNALKALVSIENLEDRWNGEGDFIDRLVVEYLWGRFS